VLMLGMLCALVGSSTWLTVATAIGLPVSTTHCIVGGVIGMGIATVGAEGISWSWEKKGVVQIVASWVIAPAIAGAFAAIIFLITKHGVLRRRNPLKWGFVMVPVYFGITSGILTMLIVWKGVRIHTLGGSVVLTSRDYRPPPSTSMTGTRAKSAARSSGFPAVSSP